MGLSRTEAADLAAYMATPNSPATIGDIVNVLEAWEATKLKENML